MDCIEFEIPYPPSANQIWRKGRRVTYLNPKYKQFLNEVKAAVFSLNLPKTPYYDGPVDVTLEALLPDRRRRDIDNIIKPTLDALTKAGMWADDSQVWSIKADKKGYKKRGCIIVLIRKKLQTGA